MFFSLFFWFLLQILYEQGASTMKRFCLELGGNAPFIVFKSADIKLAVEKLIAAKLRANGQVRLSLCFQYCALDNMFDLCTSDFQL